MAKKRAKLSKASARMKTPPTRPPPAKIIGSSCTWRTAELQELKVDYTSKEVDCKSLFENPERWFNFDDLAYYRKGNTGSVFVISVCISSNFMIVKDQLLSIGSLEEASDRDVLLDKAPWWASVFADFSALHVRETVQRKENLSTKRKARSDAKHAVSGRNSPPSPSPPIPKRPRTTTSVATTVDESAVEKGIYSSCINHPLISPSSRTSIRVDKRVTPLQHKITATRSF